MVPFLNQYLFTQEFLRGLYLAHWCSSDITKHIESPLRLFADDYILYRTIKTHEDATKLQQDLDLLHEWAVKIQCNQMYYYALHKNFVTNYQL